MNASLSLSVYIYIKIYKRIVMLNQFFFSGFELETDPSGGLGSWVHFFIISYYIFHICCWASLLPNQPI